MTGEVEMAMECASKGIELGERGKSGFVEAVGRIRMGHAKILQDPSELHVPEQYYLKRLDIWMNSMYRGGMRKLIWAYPY